MLLGAFSFYVQLLNFRPNFVSIDVRISFWAMPGAGYSYSPKGKKIIFCNIF